jgi:cell division protein FtsW
MSEMIARVSGKPNEKPAPGYDLRLLVPVLLLTGAGIVMVYSASSAVALNRFGSDAYFLTKQMFYVAAGLLCLLFFRQIPLSWLRLMTYPLLLLSFFLLLLVQTDWLGYSAGGATRWIRVAGVSCQPSELARFSLVLFLAYSMERKRDRMRDYQIGFLPHILVLGLFSVPILLQPDFGSVLILFAVTWTMLFVGGVPLKHMTISLIGFLPIVYLFMVHAQYRWQRLLSFWDPWKYAKDGGYQIIHSFLAFGTGGLWGTGIGNGYQKLFYLPEPHTDFIFSVIGEEVGLVGVMCVLLLFAFVVMKGLMISMHSLERNNPYSAYLAVGLTTGLGIQAVVNMGVALGLLPTKGLTLPFLSYGGTSLVLSMSSIGILLNIGANRSKRRTS